MCVCVYCVYERVCACVCCVSMCVCVCKGWVTPIYGVVIAMVGQNFFIPQFECLTY